MAHVHYHITEVFSSLQGEGANMGLPATFVRFTSCNLACKWCDTRRVDRYIFSLNSLVEKIERLGKRAVILTGGEPSIQLGLDELVDELKARGHWIAMETNGVRMVPAIGKIDYVSVSPKADFFARYIDKSMVRKADEVRIVATSPDIIDFCERMRGLIDAKRYYVSPVELENRIHYRRALTLLSKLNHRISRSVPPWMLSIQMHKVIGLR